jgi:hypothetical protein
MGLVESPDRKGANGLERPIGHALSKTEAMSAVTLALTMSAPE